MISILSFLLASYIIIAFGYTWEALVNKELCEKYWYIVPIVFIWCILISLLYFPYDFGHKLYKKLR